MTAMNCAQATSSMLLDVHRDRIKVYQGRGAQDGHLHFHTAPELCQTKTKSVGIEIYKMGVLSASVSAFLDPVVDHGP